MIQQYIKKYVFVLGTFLSVGFFVIGARGRFFVHGLGGDGGEFKIINTEKR